jgi:splicing factor 3A subunit 1
MDKILSGELGDESPADKDEKGDGADAVEAGAAVDMGQEPPPPEFIIELPNISPIDLCVHLSPVNSFCF